jgi:hypothetical protein
MVDGGAPIIDSLVHSRIADDTMLDITIPISPGELIDKITILELKLENIIEPSKLANVRREWGMLIAVRDAAIPTSPENDGLTADLKAINARLWRIEDGIRDCERRKDFGPDFVALARSVYINNDDRARLKQSINHLLGSATVEEKSYQQY